MGPLKKPRFLLDSVILGLAGCLSAQAFLWMLRVSQNFFLGRIAGYRPPEAPVDLRQVIGPHGLWLIPVVTTIGGLLSGAIVYGFAPEAEGHGTDTVVKAVHWTGSVIRPRVAPLKMIASAITIGSGGSAGREGPTALITAGFASMYAGWFRRPEPERRVMVLMGMAAGLSAIFRSPIGTAIFAVEVPYNGTDFEGDALIYCMLASIVAYAANGWFAGWKPLFQAPVGLSQTRLADYPWYIALGVAAGIVATVLPEVFYRMRDGFAALRVPIWTKPAIGGLAVGLIALRLPEVLGGGYGWIQQAINGEMALRLLLVLMIAKIIALSLTVSSGGSGGVFAPSLFVGAMLGASFSRVFPHGPQGLVIAGMAAVFGAAGRVPIATLLLVAEMTGGYQLLVPAGLAVMLSYLIQFNLSPFFRYGSLYEAQVAGRYDSPAHRAENIRVALQLLEKGGAALPQEVSQLHLAALMQSGIALDLTDGSRFVVGSLKPDSPWTGKTIGSRKLSGSLGEASLAQARIVAVLRGKSVMLNRPGTILQPGDRLFVIAPQRAVSALAQHLSMTPLAGPGKELAALSVNTAKGQPHPDGR